MVTEKIDVISDGLNDLRLSVESYLMVCLCDVLPGDVAVQPGLHQPCEMILCNEHQAVKLESLVKSGMASMLYVESGNPDSREPRPLKEVVRIQVENLPK
jgi:hypothetical protein